MQQQYFHFMRFIILSVAVLVLGCSSSSQPARYSIERNFSGTTPGAAEKVTVVYQDYENMRETEAQHMEATHVPPLQIEERLKLLPLGGRVKVLIQEPTYALTSLEQYAFTVIDAEGQSVIKRIIRYDAPTLNPQSNNWETMTVIYLSEAPARAHILEVVDSRSHDRWEFMIGPGPALKQES